MNILEAFNIVKPLTEEERQHLHDIAIDLAKPGTLIIQDDECPLCLNCGQRLNINGVCATCGRVRKEMR